MKNLNTFEQTPELGFVSFTNNPGGASVISGINGAADVITAGMPVELIADTSPALSVKKLSATSVLPFGFAIFNAKRNAHAKYEALEIARDGVIIYLTAEGTFTKGARLKLDDLVGGVVAAAATDDAFGEALDSGVANKLVRVQIKYSKATPAPVGGP